MAAGAEFWITYCVIINGVNNTPYNDTFSSSLSGTPETAVFSDSGVVFYDYRGEDGEVGSLNFPNPYKYNNEYYQIAAIHCDGSDAIDKTFNVSSGCQIVVYYGEDPENGGNDVGGPDQGGNQGGNSGNNSNPSTAIIRYFFKSSGDPADYTTGYVGYDEYTATINHYGLSLVAGSNTTRTLTYYTDSEQSETGSYSIASPKKGYLLYNIVSLPELGQEDYKKENFDIKVYCFKAPTITVAYTSTPDTLFGNPPATITVQPNAYGKVGSFAADWGMIGGMVVTTNFKVNSGYKFLNWTIKKGGTAETKTGNEYQYNVNTFDDVTITANFERLPAVKLQVNPSGAGTVSPSAGTITPTGNDYKIKLTASPNENYKFDNWTKNSATISSSREYTYTATKGENTTITANFSSTTQPDTPDTPEAPTDGEIATNDYIYNLCAYANTSTYSLSGSGDYVENKCPTKSHILTNNGGQLINIPNSYSDDQCVKESDLSRNSRTINFIIRNSTGAAMNGTTISMYENGGSTKTHSVTWPSTNNNTSGEVSSSYTINSNDFSKFNSSLKFKWDGTYWVNKKLNCQFNNGSLGKNIKVNGKDSLNHMTGSVDFTIDEKLDYFIRISNNTANIIFIISQA